MEHKKYQVYSSMEQFMQDEFELKVSKNEEKNKKMALVVTVS